MTYPSLIELNVVSAENSNDLVVAAIVDAAARHGVRFRGGGSSSAEQPDVVERAPLLTRSVGPEWSAAMRLFFEPDLVVLVYGPPGSPRKIAMDVHCDSESAVRTRVPRVVDFARAIASALVVEGSIGRGGVAPRVGPEPPLVDADFHAAILGPARIVDAYESLEAFLQAGWTSVEDVAGGHKHVTRALDAATTTEFLARTLELSWALSRRAKPARTRYPASAPADDDERAIFEA